MVLKLLLSFLFMIVAIVGLLIGGAIIAIMFKLFCDYLNNKLSSNVKIIFGKINSVLNFIMNILITIITIGVLTITGYVFLYAK